MLMPIMSAHTACLVIPIAGQSGISDVRNLSYLPRLPAIVCTKANTCRRSWAPSRRRLRNSTYSSAEGVGLSPFATASPNLSQLGDTPSHADSTRIRSCVGIASPTIHLRTACTDMGVSPVSALNLRCTAVGLTATSAAVKAARRRCANAWGSVRAGCLAVRDMVHHRNNFDG